MKAMVLTKTLAIFVPAPLQNPVTPLLFLIVFTHYSESRYFFYVPVAVIILCLIKSIGYVMSPASRVTPMLIKNDKKMLLGYVECRIKSYSPK